jgi:predicted alpha/beta-fold hydrolase
MDLALCVDALERRANTLYQWNFVRNLRARMRRKARAWPRDYDLGVLRGVWTVRQFDEALTAPHHGFENAADYYHRASSLRVVDRIAVPTLILSAADDPFVPPEQFRRPEVTGNARIRVNVTPFGGHCGFLSDDRAHHDGYWAEDTLVRFVAHHLGVTSEPVSTARMNR